MLACVSHRYTWERLTYLRVCQQAAQAAWTRCIYLRYLDQNKDKTAEVLIQWRHDATDKNENQISTLPEAGGGGSAGWFTDSCLKTAYLSEDVDVAEEEPETGVSMVAALQEENYYSQKAERVIRYL